MALLNCKKAHRRPLLPIALTAALVLVAAALASASGYVALWRSLAKEVSRRSAELRQMSDPSSLVIEPYRRFVIAGGCLIEGPAFVGVVTYLLTGSLLGLGVIVLALVLLAVHMPSSNKLRRLAEETARL